MDHVVETATFLFTDIEGSTQLWERHRDHMPDALALHDRVIASYLEQYGGRLIKHTGDGVFAVFTSGDPLQCALDIQRGLASCEWGAVGEIRVRMALHTGEAERRGDDYFGPAINRTARVMAVGWGGQILLTPETKDSAPLPGGAWSEDLGVHLLKDLSEPQQIYALRHADLIREFPALRSLSARPNNLPQQATPFIGRKPELAEIQRLLRESGCRLVTLLGPGGMGKTRLSLQAAAENIEIFPHGVYFVPLAPISSAEFLTSAVADALKFSFQQAGDQKQQLLNYLTRKEMLLVMDNFEHVLGGADLVADLLQKTPVQVLATSRERLNLQVECLYELNGLDVPPSAEAAVFEDFEAVEMFIAYAQRSQPDYHLDPADRPAVAKICRLLGGMPLGIALAASWVRMLPPADIAAELEEDLDFLATTMRDVPERHRSMRAVFEYSWNLLNEGEQPVFARLSVFRGGFSRDAAMKVSGAKVQTLAALVDKSLIHREMDGRYQVHELLRQYAEEKLRQQPGEIERLREQHCIYYMEYLAQKEPHIVTSRLPAVAQEIAVDLENIRTGWRWAAERGRSEEIWKATLALEFFCQFQSRYLEGAELFDLAVKGLELHEPVGRAGQALAHVLVMLGWFCIRLGQFDQAKAAVERSWELFQSLNLRAVSAFATHPLSPLSILKSINGEYEEAIRLGEEAYRINTATGHIGNQANAAYALVGAYLGSGDLEKAQYYGEQALAGSRKAGIRWFDAYCLNELGNVFRARGDLERAKTCYRESYEIRQDFGDPEGMAVARNHLGQIALAQQDYDEAKQLFEQNVTTYREIGDQGGLASTLNGLGLAEMAMGNLDTAREHLRNALEIAAGIQFIPLMLSVASSIGELFFISGQRGRGLEVLSSVLAHPASGLETKAHIQALLDVHRLGSISRSEGLPDMNRVIPELLNELTTDALKA